jgi:hypothetical protein
VKPSLLATIPELDLDRFVENMLYDVLSGVEIVRIPFLGHPCPASISRRK